MLIAKGYDVRLKIGTRKIAAPASFGMLHDPEGASWPANSILVARFSKDGREIEDDFAESYFGDPPMGGEIDLPPKSLGEWHLLGEVEKIEYTRTRPHGLPSKYEGPYYHIFDGSEGVLSLLSVLFKAPKPQAFRRNRILRLELPDWAQLDERGFIWP